MSSHLTSHSDHQRSGTAFMTTFDLPCTNAIFKIQFDQYWTYGEKNRHLRLVNIFKRFSYQQYLVKCEIEIKTFNLSQACKRDRNTIRNRIKDVFLYKPGITVEIQYLISFTAHLIFGPNQVLDGNKLTVSYSKLKLYV